MMRIGVISDLHLFNKTIAVEKALSKLSDIHVLLLIGDIADRAEKKQYDLLLRLIDEKLHGIPVYCVSGNHDNPAKDDANYRQFEQNINGEYPSIVDSSGAFYKCINEQIDLIGLNPLYHQKQFYFPNKGQQFAFLSDRLAASPCKYHIVLCHPPLIAHNPQRTADMAPYIVVEQDKRLQTIMDRNKNIIFLSGHTHIFPAIEFDEAHGNLYLNNGSICPTTVKGTESATRQGNVTLIDISKTGISIMVKGIYNDRLFIEKQIAADYKL